MSADYTPRELSELLLQQDVQVVDVREPHEFSAGHISGALAIPLGQLAEGVAEINRGAPVVLVCRSGGRSALATEALTQAGYDAHNMSGGMLEWDASGLAIEPAGGHVV
jgi:rhodanese-related sulfurtransferase